MKSGVTILAGLLAGILVAVGVLAAFVFVGPDPVGLRPTPAPTVMPSVAQASVAPTAISSPAVSGSAGPSAAGGSGGPGGSPGASGDAGQTGFRIGQTAPPLVVPQLGGGTIDLAALRGKPVWVNFMQTTCPECIDEFPRMNGFQARYEKDGLVVIAVDIREDEATVASFAQRLGATFPMGLDFDGAAQRTWGTYALPIHFWVGREGIIRAGALGGIGPDVMASSLAKILPGVTVTP